MDDIFRAFDRVWLGFRLVAYAAFVATALLIAVAA